MTKLEFLMELNQKLSGLPGEEIRERLNFYSEMIEDRIEEGLSEEEAVLAVGSVDEVAEQILSDIPLSKIAKERIKPKRSLKSMEIVLLVLGSPLWLSLLIAVASVVLLLYVCLWAALACLWAVFASAAAVAVFALAEGVSFLVCGNVLSGIALTGASLMCAGLSIFLLFGCRSVTKGVLMLTKKIALEIKKCFIVKEAE